jgi:endonuclease/exonuclease/phosphatase family metal-dependent hydrolase
MSFNVRRDVPEDGAHAWPRRRDAVAAVVLAREPDVLAVQEATLPMLRDLDARLPRYARVGGEREAWPGEEPNVLYVRPDVIVVRAHGDFALAPDPRALGAQGWGSWGARTALWAVVEWRATRARRLVVATHFDHVSPRARAASARLVQRLAGPRSFLLGDFNARPRASAAHRILAGTRADPLAGAGGTMHGWSDYEGPRLDWILVPRDVRVLAAQVVRDRPGGAWPSDHDPVLVAIEPPAASDVPDPLPPSARQGTSSPQPGLGGAPTGQPRSCDGPPTNVSSPTVVEQPEPSVLS